jgi:TonB family protein
MVGGDRRTKSKGVLTCIFLFAVVALGALNGCVTSSFDNPESVERINAKLDKYDRGLPDAPQDMSQEDKDKLRRLWRDKPEYVALVDVKHAKTVRIVTVAVPKYPYWEAWAKRPADVSISYIVGVDGKVEDARLLESSDSRFDQPALDAIRQFIFLPALGPSGRPELAIEVQAFHFRMPSKQ